MTDIHEQLRTLLDKEGAVYRVLEHEAEGRTEVITQIRGNRIEQAIKSMVVQVRMSKKENLYYLANVPGDCRVDFDAIKAHFNAASIGMAPREKAEALTGCVIGSIPPFTFNEKLGLLADPMIKENDEVVFNAGSLEKSIYMKMEDYFRIANPQIVSIALRG
ncbi:YbaK/EbsC family protein [Candidatus Villigracilis affinis]|uniref:YbaK/EbsC family protein n=1 Tax=Candidatus Villigracilis affinis TaxID=3140682 RepID=UPI002A1E0C43|nr:YbaK/prolyl-tRNA synthetase associated domain-containing protein [Anaerolineales bacterium]